MMERNEGRAAMDGNPSRPNRAQCDGRCATMQPEGRPGTGQTVPAHCPRMR